MICIQSYLDRGSNTVRLVASLSDEAMGMEMGREGYKESLCLPSPFLQGCGIGLKSITMPTEMTFPVIIR